VQNNKQKPGHMVQTLLFVAAFAAKEDTSDKAASLAQALTASEDALGRQVNRYGEVVTSRYFHRKAVLSTLDQLGKTKTHTQVNLQKTRHTRPSSKKVFFLFFLYVRDMSAAMT
jgi:hypothetical protein